MRQLYKKAKIFSTELLPLAFSLLIYQIYKPLYQPACLVGTVVRRWTAVLEVVGSLPALAKQRIKFLGFLRLPTRVGL